MQIYGDFDLPLMVSVVFGLVNMMTPDPPGIPISLHGQGHSFMVFGLADHIFALHRNRERVGDPHRVCRNSATCGCVNGGNGWRVEDINNLTFFLH